MKVRNIEVEMRAGTAEGERGEAPAAGEVGVRDACRAALVRAGQAALPAVELPAVGVGSSGLSVVHCAKIMAQEIIRFARADAAGPRRITVLCPGGDLVPYVSAAEGYLRHFLDVLLWGPFMTVDAIIEVSGGIVLVTRSNPPLGVALPGGFVDYGESLETAVRRESKEETGLDLLDLAQFHTYSDPGRDPRFHTITTVFSARAEGAPRAGDDAAAVQVVPFDRIETLRFAFDHRQVLQDWLKHRSARR